MSARRQHSRAYYQTEAGRQTIAKRVATRARNRAIRSADAGALEAATAIGPDALVDQLQRVLTLMEASLGFTATQRATTVALERVAQANRLRLAREGWIT